MKRDGRTDSGRQTDLQKQTDRLTEADRLTEIDRRTEVDRHTDPVIQAIMQFKNIKIWNHQAALLCSCEGETSEK